MNLKNIEDKEFLSFDEMTAQELFDHNKREYDSNNPIALYLYKIFYRKIYSLMDEIIFDDIKTLEVGCGCGESSLRIHKHLRKSSNKFHFEASEYDKRFVSIIDQLDYPFEVNQENIYEMNRKDSSFNLIFLLEVLEHLENPEKAIEELFRVTDKYVIISVPNEPIWRIANMARLKYLKSFGNTPGHINHYNLNSLTKLVEPYGKVINSYKPFPWLIILVEKHD